MNHSYEIRFHLSEKFADPNGGGLGTRSRISVVNQVRHRDSWLPVYSTSKLAAMFSVPIAFVIFNRPDHAAESFQRIREIRPSRLFIISDASRLGIRGESELVQQSRQVTEQIDWQCEVTRIYADENMGCGKRISSGVSTAMEHVDRLIVLEDDCIADPTFFSYCDELLKHYEDDERVMSITGNNFQNGALRGAGSYYFSKYPHCWGWATWRRAWSFFDLSASAWPDFRDSGLLRTHCHHPRELEYWTEIFNRVHEGRSQSWAFPWVLACWMNHGLTAIPQRNLVSNIGFGENSTHTRKSNGQANIATESMNELIHPESVHRDFMADQYTDENVFSGTQRRDAFKRIEKTIQKYYKMTQRVWLPKSA